MISLLQASSYQKRIAPACITEVEIFTYFKGTKVRSVRLHFYHVVDII